MLSSPAGISREQPPDQAPPGPAGGGVGHAPDAGENRTAEFAAGGPQSGRRLPAGPPPLRWQVPFSPTGTGMTPTRSYPDIVACAPLGYRPRPRIARLCRQRHP